MEPRIPVQSGRSPIEQHKPVKHPDWLFREFLDENRDYAEILQREVDRMQGSMVVEEKPVTMHSLVEEQIVQFAAEKRVINPFLLSTMRNQLALRLVVNATPTSRGDQMLPYGKYGPVKRLKGKPTSSFSRTERWLLIADARSAGLLNVEIETDEGVASYFDQVQRCYKLRYGSQWDYLRDRIIKRAFYMFIWPQFVAETETDLFSKGSSYVKSSVEDRLRALLTDPLYTKRKRESSPLKACRVLAFCFHPDNKKEIGMALVNSEGTVEQSQVFNPHLLQRTRDIDYEKFVKELIDTTTQLQPRSPRFDPGKIFSSWSRRKCP